MRCSKRQADGGQDNRGATEHEPGIDTDERPSSHQGTRNWNSCPGNLFLVPPPPEESVFVYVVMRRHATREIVQVNFKTTTAAALTWAVFGNHWPSRSGGQFESEGYCAIAGETLSYFHQRVLEVHG